MDSGDQGLSMLSPAEGPLPVPDGSGHSCRSHPIGQRYLFRLVACHFELHLSSLPRARAYPRLLPITLGYNVGLRLVSQAGERKCVFAFHSSREV